MKEVYMLEHEYEYTYKGKIIDEIKLIGIFSSEEKAKKVINELKDKKGFKDFPITCFNIGRVKLDSIEWIDGFISTEEAIKG
ncbi:SPOR domain-containing protein [Empedobacter brevis]|uniref:DUF7336 domain-containing protein n=1 Tax=Empedobacter brevis NBRC 14943 = ATCC 43319 TaxID=1218108 RepID=A0A511NEH9_9FLAO|nr:SPOR domain-containing protein [Empedobacter brevis]GEM51165.1 hypothetical protein EB1_09550 [Empedobacter brevis NBRC 14943 = ATCC 43319]